MKQMMMKMFIAGAVISAIWFTGCGLNPEESTTPTITIDNIADIDVGTTRKVTGKVEAGEEITRLSYKIETSSGTTVSSDKIDVTGPSSSTTDKIEFTANDPITITVKSSAIAGNYKLIITATAGTEVDAKFNFSVKGVTILTLDAGANSNNDYGSSVDLDSDDGAVWKKTDAANNVEKIDFCYAHSGTENNDKVGSAEWANISEFNFAKDWSNTPNCKMHALTMTESEFNAIDTKEEISSLWDDSKLPATPYKLVVTEGSVFIIKTTEGAYALVRVTDQITGSTGKITVKVAK